MAQFPNTDTADGIWSLKQAKRAILGSYWPEIIFTNTGGTITDITDGGVNYRVHTFTSSGTFDIPSGAISVDCLVVAGGGAGGSPNFGNYGGGGGAGGLIFKPNHQLSQGSYAVTVGLGGDGESNDEGDNSEVFGFTAIGGGRGGSNSISSSDGGSGGGGGYNNPGASGLQPSSADGGFGNDGGDGTSGENSGAGGGGAGQPGNDGAAIQVPDGGDGVNQVTIGGTTYNFAELFGTGYGEIINGEAWFAGGGGGSRRGSQGPPYGVGGQGGGGNGGGYALSPGPGLYTAGLPYTGGGGGGGSNEVRGSDGGSGIVIIRYQI